MIDLQNLINSGAHVKLEVTPHDLLEFGKKLIKDAQEEIRKEMEAVKAAEAETYLSTKEVCDMFDVCEGTLIQWEKRGYLVPAMRLGRKKKFSLSEIKALMHSKHIQADEAYLMQKGREAV